MTSSGDAVTIERNENIVAILRVQLTWRGISMDGGATRIPTIL
jgi:hypothetical protein